MNEQAKVTGSPDPWARRRRLRTPMITVVSWVRENKSQPISLGTFARSPLPTTCISLVLRQTILLHRNSGV